MPPPSNVLDCLGLTCGAAGASGVPASRRDERLGKLRTAPQDSLVDVFVVGYACVEAVGFVGGVLGYGFERGRVLLVVVSAPEQFTFAVERGHVERMSAAPIAVVAFEHAEGLHCCTHWVPPFAGKGKGPDCSEPLGERKLLSGYVS